MNRRLIIILSAVLVITTAIFLYFFLPRAKPVDTTASLPAGLSQSVLPTGSTGYGGGSDQNLTVIIGGATTTVNGSGRSLPRLRHLTLVPTAGDVIMEKQISVIQNRVKTEENAYFVRYMERSTGHIFDIKTDSPAASEISNTTLPKIYEAAFTPAGNIVIARFLSSDDPDQVLTYSITLKDKKIATTTDQTVANMNLQNAATMKDIVGAYLSPDINEIAMSPSGAKLLSLLYANNGGKFIVSGASGEGAKVALVHPLREWLLALPSESTAVITTKPSGRVNGFAYLLNLATGSLRKIVGNIAGLTLLPNNDGSTYLGAGTPSGAIKLFVYNDGDTKVLGLSTLPEKCVWANTETDIAYCSVPVALPSAVYPDAWYQGKVSFKDQLWKINTVTGATTLISDLPKESGQSIDGTYLELSSDDKYMTFINKTDLTLWGLDLTRK